MNGYGIDAVLGEEAITTQGQAGTDYWPLGDQVNTPHEVVNNASTTVDHIITNTFGVVTSESNTSIHHWAGFEGGHFDPDTALTNDDHRWYDPVVGRWMSEDPTGFAAGDANLARYAGNDPAIKSDPTGLEPGEGQELPVLELRTVTVAVPYTTWEYVPYVQTIMVVGPNAQLVPQQVTRMLRTPKTVWKLKQVERWVLPDHSASAPPAHATFGIEMHNGEEGGVAGPHVTATPRNRGHEIPPPWGGGRLRWRLRRGGR